MKNMNSFKAIARAIEVGDEPSDRASGGRQIRHAGDKKMG